MMIISPLVSTTLRATFVDNSSVNVSGGMSVACGIVNSGAVWVKYVLIDKIHSMKGQGRSPLNTSGSFTKAQVSAHVGTRIMVAGI